MFSKTFNFVLAMILGLNYVFVEGMPPPEPAAVSNLLFQKFNTTTTTTTKKPIDPRKKLVLCEMNMIEDTARVISSCDLFSYNFTFYAYFRQKRSLQFKSLKDLAKTLSNYSLCSISYMKYNFWNENLEYLSASDDLYWHEGRKLNDTYHPEVFIIPDPNRKSRHKIIYECQLPKSDVFYALKPTASRSSHSHPVEHKRVTVSGLHIKLFFTPLNGININFKSSQPTTSTSTKFYFYYSDSQLSSKPQTSNDDAAKLSTERYMIFFDGKCRNCIVNLIESTVDQNELINPTYARSIKCPLKANTCVNDGKCYTSKEASLKNNQFYCDTKFNIISNSGTYYTCTINNGGCDSHQKCIADEFGNKLSCSNQNF